MKPASDSVQVVLDWEALGGPTLVGRLAVDAPRGLPLFSFAYDATWLRDHRGVALDPDLSLVPGRTWPRPRQPNFGVFLDSAPDRWGRTLGQSQGLEGLAAKKPSPPACRPTPLPLRGRGV